MMRELGDQKNPPHLWTEVGQTKVTLPLAGLLQPVYKNSHPSGTHVLQVGQIDDQIGLALFAQLVDLVTKKVRILESDLPPHVYDDDTVLAFLTLDGKAHGLSR